MSLVANAIGELHNVSGLLSGLAQNKQNISGQEVVMMKPGGLLTIAASIKVSADILLRALLEEAENAPPIQGHGPPCDCDTATDSN